ncbi:STAS/SEC14 domain-containing protein [Halopiger aswanensis]|uniref:SpoIIAA-like protein n=1 Tax=Halopiger aswanensis TaxID=148449 RepID=A0A419VXZ7_9EURY|nr:STAS/SEC14 domain-containing protein [Halopiger aswanensis]RKD88095.1 SpoIIAA-like protein [Halopiger aswanensis]
MAHYESDVLTVEWDSSLEAVVMNWHDFATGETYREGLNAGLDLAIEKGAANWLADLRDLGTLSEDDQQWTQEEWHPRAFESSLSNMAIVQPESVVANLSVEDLVQEVGSNTTSRIFDDRDDARGWLREQ